MGKAPLAVPGRIAARKLLALAERVPSSPAIWHNLAMLRGWLADEAGAVEAYAALCGARQGRWMTPSKPKPKPRCSIPNHGFGRRFAASCFRSATWNGCRPHCCRTKPRGPIASRGLPTGP